MEQMIRFTAVGTSHGDPTVERYNYCSLIEFPGFGGVLVDAGNPALATLIRMRYSIADLRYIFITHTHMDHIGNLPDILKHVQKHRSGRKLIIFIPEIDAAETILRFTELSHIPISPEVVEFRETRAGMILEEDGLTVESIPTAHLEKTVTGKFPSSGYKFSFGGKKLLFTGDLAYDFHDFPAAEEVDLMVTELTHYPWETAFPVLGKAPFKRLIFSHIGDQYNSPEAKAKFRSFADQYCPYPCTVANDGDVFEI